MFSASYRQVLLLTGFTLAGGALGFYVEEKVEAHYKVRATLPRRNGPDPPGSCLGRSSHPVPPRLALNRRPDSPATPQYYSQEERFKHFEQVLQKQRAQEAAGSPTKSSKK